MAELTKPGQSVDSENQRGRSSSVSGKVKNQQDLPISAPRKARKKEVKKKTDSDKELPNRQRSSSVTGQVKDSTDLQIGNSVGTQHERSAEPNKEHTSSKEYLSPESPQEPVSKDAKSFEILKVQLLQESTEGGSLSPGRIITSFQTSRFQPDSLLGQVRYLLGSKITSSHAFAYADGTPAEDDISIDQYLQHEAQTEQGPSSKILFVLNAKMPGGDVSDASTILASGKFSIKVCQWKVQSADAGKAGVLTSRGTLLAKDFADIPATKITLVQLRSKLAKLAGMSAYSAFHKFCTIEGTTVAEESTTLIEYLSIDGANVSKEAVLPSITIAYKRSIAKNEPDVKPPKELWANIPGKYEPGMSKLSDREKLFAGEKQAEAFNRASHGDRAFNVPANMLIAPAVEGEGTSEAPDSAALLNEIQWQVVLSSCGIMHGWVVDKEKNQVRQARKPAFRLKTAKSQTLLDLTKNALSRKTDSTATESVPKGANHTDSQHGDDLQAIVDKSKRDREESFRRQEDERNDEQSKPTPKPMEDFLKLGPGIKSDGLSKIESKLQGRSENRNSPDRRIGGTIEDAELTESSSRSTKTEAELRADIEQELRVKIKAELDAEAAAKVEAETNAKEQGDVAAATALSKPVVIAIPNYIVNDNSHIEVTMSQHELETSMARNDFSSSSTEASMSGGYGGFAMSVSGGVSSSNQNSNKNTNNSYKKTMIASYLFPRADIMLEAEDLEPTPELAAAITKIATTRNINDMRALLADFGQLFCRRVTVGGRLQSTQVIDENSTLSEHEQKEQFKMSIGVQVTTPYGGGGVKHEKETGSGSSDSRAEVNKNERHVFDATGGDTILASNPMKWAATVGRHANWRVISRDNLTSLIDFIASLHGFQGIKEIFLAAVPVLTRHIELPADREVRVRLRLASSQVRLSKSYAKRIEITTKSQGRSKPDDTELYNGRSSFGDPLYYLGHIPDSTVEPRRFELEKPTEFWGGIVEDKRSLTPMFTPSKYRAPAILGYEDTDMAVISEPTNKELLDTVWSIIAPFDNALAHGVRVSLKTVPREREIEVPNPLKPPIQDTKLPSSEQLAAANANSGIMMSDREWDTARKDNAKLAPVLDIVKLMYDEQSKKKQAPPPTDSKPVQPDFIKQTIVDSPASLIVFRNRQGEYLPGMSMHDEVHYWRILKVGATRAGEKIQEGDKIRLAWLFSDQNTGFRDFSHDIYGRRRGRKPADVNTDVLLLKLPWPRFEALQTASTKKTPGVNAMIMGTAPTTEVYWAGIRNVPQIKSDEDRTRELGPGQFGQTTYVLQDVSFTLDVVANNGLDDAGDYLIPKNPVEKPPPPPSGAPAPAPMHIDARPARPIETPPFMANMNAAETLFFMTPVGALSKMAGLW